MEKVSTNTKEKMEQDIQNKVNHLSKELNGITDLHVIILERQNINQTSVGAMVNQGLVESVTIAKNQDIERVNAQRNLSLKESVSIATNKGNNIQSARPRNGTQQSFCQSYIWLGLKNMVRMSLLC